MTDVDTGRKRRGGRSRATHERRERDRIDQPQEIRRGFMPKFQLDGDRFGVLSEQFARFMGTATFLIWMSVFVIIWLAWNWLAPVSVRFDPYSFTFLTLVLSLQASYAAPLILLAQNRQDDRDRVALEQDRNQNARSLADTEFLTREVASLRVAMRETATRDFVRSELRSLLEEMEERGHLRSADDPGPSASASPTGKG
ncbi:DUF1003 domain-containing protein [Allobranchiibius sp. CTAmp26]|uniref:DUF1003 domain-containing protein n=1 Tax=Allobranchiibius sp. CTAmp26 TaxID=2815214 RepID=UPI001AA11C34|nr:DUF1003 domain-containing protein [Allobranchiibius sp. CTAmp26]